MGRASRTGRRIRLIGAALLIAGATPVLAQSTDNTAHPGQGNSGLNGNVIGAGSGSSQGAAGNNTISTGQGGVANTGLGEASKAPNAPGTGNSVKGPAGQGISNSTDTTVK